MRQRGFAGFQKLTFIVALVTAVAAGTAFATYIQKPTPLPFAANTAVIKACKLNSTGALRITATNACKKGETLLIWSQQGPAGPAGPQGAAGNNASIASIDQLVGISCGGGQGIVSIVEDAPHSDKYLLKCNIPDTPCAVANGAGTCNHYGDVTAVVCNANFANIDGNLSNGCETNLLTSLANCGAIGSAVPIIANGTATCTNGVPTLQSCTANFADIDGSLSNGCEINLLADVSNCGTVGNVVPAVANATKSCTGGLPSYTCSAGFGNADSNWANGCETDLRTSLTNCGSVGNVVPAIANGTSACVAGVPTIIACSAGYANTNGVFADGCEARIL